MIYGYCRISTSKQNITRQERNIKAVCPSAIIIKEAYTGTKIQGRKGLDRIISNIKKGDMIIFDSVSRMSRNAEEGFDLYQDLFNKGVELRFLKEPHIDTQTYKAAMKTSVPMTGTTVDLILQGVNAYLMELAKSQIYLAFQESQQEVEYLHERTREGLITAKLNGKRVGTPKGSKLTVKKAAPAKEIIKTHNKSFGGSLSDTETAKLAGISRNTFYKYKKELFGSL